MPIDDRDKSLYVTWFAFFQSPTGGPLGNESHDITVIIDLISILQITQTYISDVDTLLEYTGNLFKYRYFFMINDAALYLLDNSQYQITLVLNLIDPVDL
jgi:hypothetical protein